MKDAFYDKKRPETENVSVLIITYNIVHLHIQYKTQEAKASPKLGNLEADLADLYTSQHPIIVLNTMDGNWILERVHGRMILEALPGPLVLLQMTRPCSWQLYDF